METPRRWRGWAGVPILFYTYQVVDLYAYDCIEMEL